jgi:tetratricopeptide (TPR) repeat protein
MDDLRERIVAAVQFHWSNDYDVRLNTPPSSYEALREFEHGWRTWGTDFEETIAAFSRALDLDPNFHTPRFPLIIVYLNIGEREEAARELAAAEGRRGDFTAFERTSLDWCEAKVKMMRTKALTFQRRLVKLAPHIAWLRYNLSVETYRLNRPRETIEILAPLLPTFQDESLPYAWFALGRASAAHHLLGEYERHLEWANVGLEMFPDVGQFFSHKCAALAGMGRPDAVNGVIDDCSRVQLREDTFDFCTVAIYAALELRAHGHRPESDALALRATEWCERQMIGGDFKASDPDGLRRYSWALRVAGRWDEARAPLMELKERERWPIGTAGALGLIAARTDDRAEAWRVFNDFPESDSSSAPAARCYWRACIASYLGEKDVAVELLKEGYSKGLGHTITLHVDVDLEPLWDYPPFQELIEPKG